MNDDPELRACRAGACPPPSYGSRRRRGTRPRPTICSLGGTGFETWKKFDKELARELSMFFTGKLYSREVISQAQRELCAVASLTVLHRPRELHAHVHAALNVGATRPQVAEVIFQQVTYGGMPVVVEALDVLKTVLEERGEWES